MVKGLIVRSGVLSIHFLLVLSIGLLLILAFAVAQQDQSVEAAADTCTWTGLGGNTNLSTAGNWTGCDNGNVPEYGDTVVFPTGPTNKNVIVDSDIIFASITVSGSAYNISSAGFEVIGATNSITISGDNNSLSTYLRLYPSTTSTFTHSGTGTDIDNYIVIQPFAADTDVVFDIDTDVSLPMISQTAVGGGSSVDTVTKTGAGTMQLTGTAISGVTADQGIFIEEGRWQCDSTNCLGNTANVINLTEGGDPDGAELNINHSGTLSNPITSATVTGENGSVIISGSPTLSGAISVTESLNMFVSGSSTATISSAISIANGQSLVSYGVDGYATNAYNYSGIISGNGGLIVDDAHVTLSGSSNTYAGATELHNSALLTVTNNNSQGAQSVGTTVNSGTTIEYDNVSNIGFGEPLTISGTGIGGSYPGAAVKSGGEMQLEGGVTLAGATTFYNATDEVFEVTSVIGGNYDLTLTSAENAGGFSIEPNGNNGFDDLTVNGAEVTLWGAGDLVVPNNLTVNAIDDRPTSISLNNDNMIANDSVVTLNNDTTQEAELISNGVVETVGTIAGDGNVLMLDSDSQFSLGSGDTTGIFSGVVEGYTNSQFQIIDGRWTFAGDNTDVGNGFSSYYVNGGTFIADAINTSLGFSPFSISSGVLGGSDVIGPVAGYGGAIAPGESPGCLNPDGDVAFNGSATELVVELDGTTICSQYDKLAASGIVYLNDAILTIDLGFQPSNGDTFTIVEGSSIVGTFAGLADGSIVTVGGTHNFRINYSSDDVTLTYLANATAVATSNALAETGINSLLVLFVSLLLITGGGAYSLRDVIRSLSAIRTHA